MEKPIIDLSTDTIFDDNLEYDVSTSSLFTCEALKIVLKFILLEVH